MAYPVPEWSQWQPHDHAVLCFCRDRTNGSDQLLLIEKKRGLGAGKVNGPGGKQEPGESLAETARRETLEEVCIDVSDARHAGILKFAFVDGYHLEVHIYVSESWAGTPCETDEALPFWCPVDAIPYQRMWEDDGHWLPQVLAGLTVDSEMVFDGDEMVWWDLRFSDGSQSRGQRD